MQLKNDIPNKTIIKGIFPVVSAIPEGNKYKVIEDFRARIDIKGKQLFVPFGQDEHNIRTHEITHGLYSPECNKINGAIQFVVLATEDYRVNSIMQRAGIKKHYSKIDLKFMPKIVEVSNPYEQVMLLVCGGDKDFNNKYRGMIQRPDLLEKTEKILSKIDVTPYDFKATETAARAISRLFRKDMKETSKKPVKDSNDGNTEEKQDDKETEPAGTPRFARNSNEDLNKLIDDLKKQAHDEAKAPTTDDNNEGKQTYGKSDPVFQKVEGKIQWGKLLTDHVPLNLVYNRRLAKLEDGNKYFYSDKGYIPNRIDRLCLNKTIFKHKSSQPNDSKILILVDCSGSMDTHNILKETLKFSMSHNGEFTILLYIGEGNCYKSAGITGSNGYIRQIANNGRYTDKLKFTNMQYLGGNVVDVPALLYCKKYFPDHIKFWVCDGNVTGVDERKSNELVQSAIEVFKRDKWIQCQNIEYLIKTIKGLKAKTLKLTNLREVYSIY